MDETPEEDAAYRSERRLEPVAIVGMACRLPAEATNIENLWTSLAGGESGWSPHPKDRMMPERFYHPNPDKKATYFAKGAHYLQEDVSLFDAQFFNITETEAIVSKWKLALLCCGCHLMCYSQWTPSNVIS